MNITSREARDELDQLIKKLKTYDADPKFQFAVEHLERARELLDFQVKQDEFRAFDERLDGLPYYGG